jgi:hypothetical protein
MIMTGKLWPLLMSFLIALATFGAMLVLTNLPLLSLLQLKEFGSAVPVPAALLSFVHFWDNKKAIRVRLMKVDQAGIISLGNKRQARMRLRSPWLRLELLPVRMNFWQKPSTSQKRQLKLMAGISWVG